MRSAVATSTPQLDAGVASSAPVFGVASRWLFQEDARLDASHYAKGAFVALDALDACKLEKKPLGSLVGKLWHPVQNQARSNFKRIYTTREYGVPFVGSRDMFALPLRPRRNLSKRIPKLADLMVPEGWIVISRSGTIGNVLLVNRHLAACAITEHTIRIEPTEVPTGYLYALLASKYGQQIIEKGAFGATVDQVEPRHLAPMPVPLPPPEERDEHSNTTIHAKILRAYALRDEATDLFDEADALLHTAIGVAPFTEDDIEYLSRPPDARTFTQSNLGMTDRFDASNHVPLVRSARDKLARGRFPLAPLATFAERVFMPDRFTRIYVDEEHGVPFLTGSQAPLMRPYALKFLSLRANAKELGKLELRPDWVLVTRSGTIGRVTQTGIAWDGWTATEDLLRIVPKPSRAYVGYLTTFLMTLLGHHQMTAGIYGGVIDHLTEDDLAAVLVPDAPLPIQADIDKLVGAAIAKRDEANTLEDEAIATMEALIENRRALRPPTARASGA